MPVAPCRARGKLPLVKAWILDETPGAYRLGDIEPATVGDTDVAVRIAASALNHIDLWLARGKPRPRAFPHVPGADGAGVIAAVGSAVDRWSVGDEVVISAAIISADAEDRLGIDSVLDRGLQVMGEHRWGTHCELVVVPGAAVVAKPPTISWAQAAAYPVGFGTAWRMIRRGRVTAGERVLITGIGGGVAMAALQLCCHLGAEVLVTSRDEAKVQRGIELGAAGGFDSAGPYEPVDVVLDSIGPAIWEPAVAALRPGGRFVTCGGTSGTKVTVDIPKLFFRQHELIGSTLASYEEFAQVTAVISAGVEPIVDVVMSFADYAAALDRIRSGSQVGKIVLDHRS